MPGVIRAAVPVGTLPFSLSSKFSESRTVQMNMNEYHDGSCQRVSLVTGSRRTWNLSKRLDAFHLGLLRAFCNTVQGGPFQFYNPFETLPAFTKNPIGTSGLYLVRFSSDWSQVNGMGRSDCDIELIEISSVDAMDIGGAIVADPLPGPPFDNGGGGPGGGDDGGPGGGTLVYVPIDAPNIAGRFLGGSTQYLNMGPISYGGYLWAYGIPGNDFFPRGGVYRSTNGNTWERKGDIPHDGFNPPAKWESDNSVQGSYWDGSSSVITLLVLYPQSFPMPELSELSHSAIALMDFDMSTETYASHTLATELGSTSSTPSRFYVLKLSNGTFRVVFGVTYGINPPYTEAIYYKDYAGSWGATTEIVYEDETLLTPTTVIQDGDVVHLVYGDRTGSDHIVDTQLVPQTNFVYRRLNANGTTSTPVSLDSILGSDGSTKWAANTGIVSGDRILIPFARTSTSKIGVLVGAPKGSPTFTYVTVGFMPNNEAPMDMDMIHIGSKDYMAWVQKSADTGNQSQIYASSSSDGGTTWTLPKLMVDLDVNPTAPALDQFGDPRDTADISFISLGTQSDGTTLGLLFKTWTMYWTNAPALLP